MLVGDVSLAEGQAVVVARLLGLGYEGVAEVCRPQIGDAILHTYGHLLVGVHDGSEGNVGKSEIYPTLTYACGIEVMLLHRQLGTCVALAYLNEATAVFTCEVITVGKYLFE